MHHRIRTNPALVMGVLFTDYTQGADLTFAIQAAALMVDKLVHLARCRRKSIDHYSATIVETWVAAHFYCTSDKAFQSKNTSQASATYQGKTADFLESTYYGQSAMRLDPSGLLETLGRTERRTATVMWLGKAPNRPYGNLDGYLGDWPDQSSANPNLNDQNPPQQ